MGSAAGLILASCGTPQPQASQELAKVRRDNIESVVSVTGTVTPRAQSRLNFRVNGLFSKYEAEVGAHVTAGQELALIDAPELDAAVAKAQAVVDAARAKVQSAEAQLELIHDGPRAGNIQQAAAGVAGAQAKLDAELAQGRAEDIAAKQAALDSANAKLALMQRASRAEDLAQGQAKLDQAKAKLEALTNGPRPEQVSIYRTQVEQAKNALLAAQLSRDATCGLGKGGACDAANAQVNAAINGVDLANQQMHLNTAGPTSTDLAQAQAAVRAAQSGLDKLRTPYTAEEIAQQQAAVAQAQDALALAQRPYTAQEIDQARAAVLSAQASLTLAQQPYQPADEKQAQAAVDAAQAELHQDQAELELAQVNQSFKSIKAPYDGVVLSETANQGEAVGPNGLLPSITSSSGPAAAAVQGDPVIVVASDKGVQINANVDETDITRVHPGQRVEITFDAFPERQFSGKVTFVPAVGTTVQNVQQYTIYVSVDQGDVSLLKAGMTANCSVVVASAGNSLVVPTSAVREVDGHATVARVDSSGESRPETVQTGLSNASNTQIVDGLQDGDAVLVGYGGSSTNSRSSGK